MGLGTLDVDLSNRSNTSKITPHSLHNVAKIITTFVSDSDILRIAEKL